MKKIILSSALLSGFILAGTQMASAAEVVKTTDTPVGIEFQSDKDTEEVPGSYRGKLAIVHKPTAFEFGKQKALGATIVYPGLAKTDQFLTVNDDRENPEGPASGDTDSKIGGKWKLTAKMAPLTNVADGKADDKIPATLTLNYADILKYDIGTNFDTDGEIIPNDVYTNTTAYEEGVTPTVALTKTVELESATGNEVVVMSKSEEDSNKVGVAAKLESTSLKLQAPTTSANQKYASKVTWTLSTGI